MGALLRSFLSAVRRPVARSSYAGIEAALEAALEQARETWPELQPEPAIFAADLARVVSTGGALTVDEVKKLKGADLFVAACCLRGSTPALLVLEREWLPKVRAAMAKQVRDDDELDDLMQSFRERLLLGDAPVLATYAGRGALSAWLCAVGVRLSLDAVRARKRFVPTDDVKAIGTALDQELAYAQRRYAKEFQHALRESFAALSREERRVLRHAHLDGLSIDAIAQAIRVHRSTAARQLNAARDHLITLTRQAMREQLGLSEAALDSLTRSVHVDLDVSLSTALRSRRQ